MTHIYNLEKSIDNTKALKSLLNLLKFLATESDIIHETDPKY